MLQSESQYLSKGGDAGILEGYKGSYKALVSNSVIPATGGKQNVAGAAGISFYNGTNGDFGKGGNSSTWLAAGGGSGYFGGGGGATTGGVVGSGAGGSSFVSGLSGCRAILNSSTKENMEFSSSPYHYSGLKFTNISTKDGALTNCNNGGNGKVEIKFLLSIRDKYLVSRKQKKCSQNFVLIILFVQVS